MKKVFLLMLVLAGLSLAVVSCGPDKAAMLRQLEALEGANRADSLMQNDSLAEALADYFDRHGSPNERMRSHYILGRTYFDLGELPRALETYMEAADCADTTAADCDYKTLSRVHAQMAEVYSEQIQLQSQMEELGKAERYARIGDDSLMSVECYVNQTSVYRLIKRPDSVVIVSDSAALLFLNMGNTARYAQTLGGAVTSLVRLGDLAKARRYIDIYERESGFFDKDGNIKKGRDMYYYIKGEYYLAVHKLDSAEVLFRELLRANSTLNRQIAGCKGLQQVYEQRNVSDSIAKYANLGYLLNDSAYSLSEMQNIQMMQASYNYNHKQFLAEKEKRNAAMAYLLLALIGAIVVIGILVSLYVFKGYRDKKEKRLQQYLQSLNELENAQTELLLLRSSEKQEAQELIKSLEDKLREAQAKVAQLQLLSGNRYAELERKIDDSGIVKHLHELLYMNPPQGATSGDLRAMRSFINEAIPGFYSTVNTPKYSLRPVEYNACLLIRTHFKPAEIGKLLELSDSHIANIRKGLLLKVFDIEGSPKQFDELILQITE